MRPGDKLRFKVWDKKQGKTLPGEWVWTCGGPDTPATITDHKGHTEAIHPYDNRDIGFNDPNLVFSQIKEGESDEG